jgi:hypothetical protein
MPISSSDQPHPLAESVRTMHVVVCAFGLASNKQDRLHCASSFANQFSIAGITGLDKYQGFGSNVLNGALGNTFSGLLDAYDSYKG